MSDGNTALPEAGGERQAAGGKEVPSPGLLLWQLQSPINVGMILRLAETFRAPVYVYDPAGVLSDGARRDTVSDFACGALERHPPEAVTGIGALAGLRRGRRLIATTIEPGAVPLTEFTWRAGDLVAIGNEYDGLPAAVTADADARLWIPLPDVYVPKPRAHAPIDPLRAEGVARDGTPNLNAAMATAIIVYDAYRQLLAARSR
jgi:tRNA (cytidine/uridine-2'-O-)-methyltransferase